MFSAILSALRAVFMTSMWLTELRILYSVKEKLNYRGKNDGK